MKRTLYFPLLTRDRKPSPRGFEILFEMENRPVQIAGSSVPPVARDFKTFAGTSRHEASRRS